jgi:Ubinuclein conserved middle domain
MQKLIKRTIFPDHLALLTERQDELLKQLQELAQAGFAKAEEEWENGVLAWGKPKLFIPCSLSTFHSIDKRQEKIRQEAAEASGATGTNSACPTRHPTEEMDVDGEDKDKVKDKEKDGPHPAPTQGQAHPPAKRYRLTDAMKAIIWELVVLSNECCRLENERK